MCSTPPATREFDRGYKLLKLQDDQIPAAREWWHRMVAQYQASRDFSRFPASVVYPALPDGSQPPPLLEDLEGHGTWPGLLVKNGFTTLGAVAHKSSVELKAIKGFGPKSLDDLIGLLAEHGMTLIDAPVALKAVS